LYSAYSGIILPVKKCFGRWVLFETVSCGFLKLNGGKSQPKGFNGCAGSNQMQMNARSLLFKWIAF
jgi:hypothetical protein